MMILYYYIQQDIKMHITNLHMKMHITNLMNKSFSHIVCYTQNLPDLDGQIIWLIRNESPAAVNSAAVNGNAAAQLHNRLS